MTRSLIENPRSPNLRGWWALKRRGVSVLDLEGLAINGLVEEFSEESCGGGRVRIVARVSGGEEVETPCMDRGGAESVERLLRVYSPKAYGQFLRPGPVMTGITSEDEGGDEDTRR